MIGVHYVGILVVSLVEFATMFIPADDDLVSPDRVNGRAFILARRSALYLFLAAAFALASAAQIAQAAAITKADNTNALNLGTSWIGGVAPGTTDVADWSGAYNTAGSLSASLGANLDWQGISVGSISGTAAGLISVGGTLGGANTLTIGTSGINMSGANQDMVLNGTVLNFNTSQTWNVAAGRNLRMGASGTGAANANVDGSNSGAVVTIAGGGVVDANQGGATGFADAAGYAGYTGKWQINAGATLRGLRNGATAWGNNTSADAITLNGGTLAVGGISGTQGNWTWNSPITLATATTSSIDQQIFSGAGRSLKLMGAISGSGNLIFKETGANDAFTNDDLGYIIAVNNPSLSGTITIGGATENGIVGRLSSVRIGGVNGATDVTTGAGTSGTLGTAAIVNNGSLTLSHSDAWTFANVVSGTGGLRIGGGVAGAGTQVVTVSGANSYNGDTTISTGTMKLGASGVIPDGAGKGNVSVNGTLDMNGFSETINGLSGAGVVDNTAAGTATLTAGANDATSTFSGSINNTGGALSLAKTGTGTLSLSGANGYTGATTISGGTLSLGAAGAGGSLNNASNISTSGGSTLQFNTTTSNIAFGNNISGSGSIVKLLANEIGLTGTNTFSGLIDIQAGKIALDGVNSANGSPNVNVASGATLSIGGGFVGGTATIGNLTGAGLIDPQFSAGAGTRTLSINQSINGVFSGVMQDATSGGRVLAIRKVGGAMLDLTGVSTYTGGTNIQGGILRVSGAGLIGGGPITVSGGAELQVDTTAGLKTFAQSIGGTGLVHKTGANNLVLQGVNTFSGQHLVDGGFLVFDSIDAENGNPKLNLNGGSLALGAAFVGNSATVSELQGSGQISPAFGATAGTKTLLVNQTTNTIYSGSIVDAGTRLMALTKDGSGTLEITGANTNTGPTTILGGVLKVSGGAAATLGTGPISIASGTTLEYDTSGGVTAPGKLVASDISGTGLLLKSGANNLRLSGNNTFTGTHRVTGGYLVYVSSNAENGAPNLELNGGNMALPEIFNGLANAATIGNLSGTSAASQIDPNFNIVATPGTRFLSINQMIDATFAGRIVAGTGSREIAVVKGGPSKLTFTNNNTYLGSTTVQGGTLQLDVGGRISGTSGVTVGNAIGSGTLLVTTTGSHSLGVGGVTLGTGATGATGTLNMQAAGGTTVSITNDLVVGELGVGIVNHSTASTVDIGNGAAAGDLVIGQTGFAPVNRSTYNLTSGGSVAADNIYVGRNTPSSGQDHQLNISGAGASVTARTDLKVGFGGRGTVNQTGPNSVVNVNGMTTFTVGDAGVGVYNLNASGGSVVDAGSAFIGTNGGNGTMNHDLGTVSIALGLTVGNTGSTGAYTMANNAANSLTVGGNELIGVGTGVGTFTQSGGTHRLTGATGSGDMTLGPSGQYTLAGGVLDFRDYVGTTPALAGTPWSPNNASALSMPSPSQFSFTGGTLIDVSTINPSGTFLQSGGSFIIGRDESPFLIPLAPTSAAALTTINGGYNQSGGAIYFDIFAPDPTSFDPFDPAQADFLDVKGNVTLDGTVNVSFLLANSSYPLFHQIWNLIAADIPGGTITRGPNFGVNGAFYRISPTNNGGQVLQVFVPEPGTAAVWSLLALTAGCFAWRRRRNAA